MLKLGTGIIFLAALLSACANPADNKSKAVITNTNTSNTATQTTPTAKQTKGEAVAISGENSKVEFTGSKVTGKHEGGFKDFSGTIDLVNGKPEESQVSFEIDVKSVFTDADGLTKHLQTGDFFDVEKFPKASFTSSKIVADSAKGAGNYTVTGDMTLRGTTKTITFPAKITVDADKVAVESEFVINRKDFGIVYAGKADDLIRDEVVIKLNLNPARKK
jgi:polyisoprenoid-binding protein YceI